MRRSKRNHTRFRTEEQEFEQPETRLEPQPAMREEPHYTNHCTHCGCCSITNHRKCGALSGPSSCGGVLREWLRYLVFDLTSVWTAAGDVRICFGEMTRSLSLSVFKLWICSCKSATSSRNPSASCLSRKAFHVGLTCGKRSHAQE